MGVVNKFDRIILSSATRCSFNTFTALITVLPVPGKKKKKPAIKLCTMFDPFVYSENYSLIIGYINSTFLSAISCGNFAYTTRAS